MDDPNKCVHTHLGMGSACAWHMTGQGTIEECAIWRCSDACKADQRRANAGPAECFRTWCAELEYAPTQDALAFWASRRRASVPRHVLVWEVDTIARACFPGYAADILGALEACKTI